MRACRFEPVRQERCVWNSLAGVFLSVPGEHRSMLRTVLFTVPVVQASQGSQVSRMLRPSESRLRERRDVRQ